MKSAGLAPVALTPSRLHTEWPGLRLPHYEFLTGPTPVTHVPALGPGVWIKDDSHSGELYGGNKVRKLEWSLAEVVSQKRKVVMTAGALGTNHGLATAIYARELGLKTVILLVDQPPNDELDAKVAAMEATGAKLYYSHTPARVIATIPLLMIRYLGARAPWILTVGGSSASGVLGFVQAAFELADQIRSGELPEPDEVVVAVGSGGSAAGLLLGMRLAGINSRVRGVLVNDATKITENKVVGMARRSLKLLERHGARFETPDLSGFILDRSQLGDGYGHFTEAATAAIQSFKAAGVALDPVYTGKAGAALLADPPSSETLLFWNTYSAPR